MKVGILAGWVFLACALLPIEAAMSQSVPPGCTSANSANATQTVRCGGGITIVAEDGAQYTVRNRGADSEPSSAELTSKALLLEVSKKPGGHNFRVETPQAIAAVRGTKWAVDVQDTRTSVLVLQGRVAVRRPRGGNQVVLGPGEGVDVDPGNEPLAVKRWGQARVDALLARLGQ
jgi:ferric-dicitrate binding protein FerR (iron transport regulator)